MSADTLDAFLEKMRIITEGASDGDRKQVNRSASDKPRDSMQCKNCGKKGHTFKECQSDPSCFYCKAKGHRQFDCPVWKKKEAKTSLQSNALVTAAVAVSEDSDEQSVAAVHHQEGDAEKTANLKISNPFVEIKNINGCELVSAYRYR